MASFLVCSVSVRASDNGLSTSDFMISICLLAPKYHVEALSHLCSLARSPNASSSLARMEMIAYSSREFLISHPPRRQGFLRARKGKREGERGDSAFHGQFALNALQRLPPASRCRPVRGPFPPSGLSFASVGLFILYPYRAVAVRSPFATRSMR